MFTLAASLPDPASSESIGWLLGSIAALCVIANQVAAFFDRFREKPAASATYATKEEHREFQTQMDAELGRERGSRKKMHEEIGQLQGDMKSIRKETEQQSIQLGDLKTQINDTAKRIDSIPARTIEMLATTKALHR
jgi:septal ring factor EnvC (AmiA/AmiB activator)